MVKLRNLVRRTRAFNLEHPTFLAMEGDNGVGKPEVLTLLPFESQAVHEDALHCVEIKKALTARPGRPATLRVVG